MLMPFNYGPIEVIKITCNVFQAKTLVQKTNRFEVTMTGHTAEVAEEKLKLFLANKPYKHLDNVSK